MTTKKPILEAVSGFYLTSDLAYMPTDMDTEAGYFVESAPVKVFDAFDRSALAEALEGALSRPNTVIPTPKTAPKDLVIGPYIGISTQKELEQKTVYISVVRLDTGFRIESLRKAPDGTADRQGSKAIDTVLPRETTYEQLAAAIIEHLKSRKDLPGALVDVEKTGIKNEA